MHLTSTETLSFSVAKMQITLYLSREREAYVDLADLERLSCNVCGIANDLMADVVIGFPFQIVGFPHM